MCSSGEWVGRKGDREGKRERGANSCHNRCPMETTSTGDLGGAQRGARGKDIGNLYRFEEPLLADLKVRRKPTRARN